jgi:2-polyprenyl-6-methoxyphenol hydroxylase-like FAD-dependent oxidoreductase
MRRIVIIGAGQAGLVLAMGLRGHDYAVTVVADRDADAVRSGRLISNQCVFDPALARERALGINLWDDQAPPIDRVAFAADGRPGEPRPGMSWQTTLDRAAQSVDQRVKVSDWMAELVRRGGEIRHRRVTPDDLDEYAREFDLVLVAAGRGPQFDALFPRNPMFSPYPKPQRAIGVMYVRGGAGPADALTFGMGPAGEFFSLPVWSVTGRVQGIGFFGLPGGPLDRWADVTDVEQHLERARTLLSTHFPWCATHLEDAEPAAPQDFLHGSILPIVRHPVGVLPSGARVLAMGDTAVTNDPVSGQGANLAAYAARTYEEAILDRGDGPFDEEFMHDAFARYWARARHATRFSNDLLAPPSDWVLATLDAAQTMPEVAHRFAALFENPADYTDWLADEQISMSYLADARTRAAIIGR